MFDFSERNGKTSIALLMSSLFDKWKMVIKVWKNRNAIEKKPIENYCPFWTHCVVRQIRIVRGVFFCILFSWLRLTSSFFERSASHNMRILRWWRWRHTGFSNHKTNAVNAFSHSVLHLHSVIEAIDSFSRLFLNLCAHVLTWIWWPKCQSFCIVTSSESSRMP